VATSTLAKFGVRYAEILAWASSITRLIVPLRPCADGRVRSSSFREELGIVFLDLSNPIPLLESLIHESAHQHFYAFEACGALTPTDDGQPTFYSPLKKTNRPLRSVFLAYHALAHIAQLYCDLSTDPALHESDDFQK